MASSKTGILNRFDIPAARTPGPLGINDAADPNTEMCMMGDTPGPLGMSGDLATPTIPRQSRVVDIPLLVFDLEMVTRFLKSVAVAKALQSYTRIGWEEYDESTIINVVYALMPWKGKPGTAVVVQGEPVQVHAKADVDSQQCLLEVFIAKAAEGPSPAVRFLEEQEQIRARALENIRETIGNAEKINQEVAGSASEGVKSLAKIKCGSDLIVTGLGLASGGLVPFAVGLGYSLVKDWAKGKDASGVALTVGTKVGKKLVKEGANAGGKAVQNAMVPKALQGMERTEAEAAILRKMDVIEKYQEKLVGKRSGKKARLNTRIRLRMAEVDELAKAASSVRRVIGKGFRIAGKSVKFVFAGKEAIDSIKELMQTCSEADE